MERKKRSKGSVWEFCCANKIFGTFEVEMRSCGQKFVTFCTLKRTLTHAAKLVVRMWKVIESPLLSRINVLAHVSYATAGAFMTFIFN